MPARIRSQISRSLTLLWAFVLASAVLLAAAALVLGGLLTHALRQQAVADAQVSLSQYTNGVLRPHMVKRNQVVVSSGTTAVVNETLAARPDILSVKVWRPDGVIAWTNLARGRIGKTYPLGHDLEEVLETGESEAELENLSDEEDKVESRLGIPHVLEVYAPIRGQTGQVIGAFEIYADASPVEDSIRQRKHLIWLATGGVFVALWALLLLLVRGASIRLRRQTEQLRQRSDDLLDAYSQLEQSSLEAIESLNATVEAKDPYTAGHSLRVQRIALAIAGEIDLTKDRMDPLRLAALLHDIGKVGVPDAVLTKPARLNAEEFELIKRHCEEGARIVGKFGPLRETVPIIRHHHERWDGSGYPHELAGDEIPIEAAVVGLADAWDAMTTDRPYARALTLEAAFAEVREGRGHQFAPAVVDAFFVAYRRAPGEFHTAETAPDVAAQAS